MNGTTITTVAFADGEYLDITYPLGDHESGTEYCRVLPDRPAGLLLEKEQLVHSVTRALYNRGTIANPEGPGRGGLAVAWLAEPGRRATS